MHVYEKPIVEKIFLRPKKAKVAGPEYSESSWSGSSCFSICRTKVRGNSKTTSTNTVND